MQSCYVKVRASKPTRTNSGSRSPLCSSACSHRPRVSTARSCAPSAAQASPGPSPVTPRRPHLPPLVPRPHPPRSRCLSLSTRRRSQTSRTSIARSATPASTSTPPQRRSPTSAPIPRSRIWCVQYCSNVPNVRTNTSTSASTIRSFIARIPSVSVNWFTPLNSYLYLYAYAHLVSCCARRYKRLSRGTSFLR